jgi:hypothetical protein
MGLGFKRMERERANEIGDGWICFVGALRERHFLENMGERGKPLSKVERQTKFEN